MKDDVYTREIELIGEVMSLHLSPSKSKELILKKRLQLAETLEGELHDEYFDEIVCDLEEEFLKDLGWEGVTNCGDFFLDEDGHQIPREDEELAQDLAYSTLEKIQKKNLL